MNGIKVSINCITYNHEKYIEKALESFLAQKTSFPYEILVYDDASSDKTPEIIRNYEQKYPDLIKSICNNENQYSKNVHVWEFNDRRAEGDYIAICEGDDFWDDPLKLQKQVDFLENNPEFTFSVHGAYRVNELGEKLPLPVRPSRKDKRYTISEIIEGGGGLFPTNSIIYRTSKDFFKPSFYWNAPISDYPLLILLGLQGDGFYMDQLMSSYRVSRSGSWTSSMTNNKEKYFETFLKIEDMLDEINQFSKLQYETSINIAKDRNKFYLNINNNNFDKILKKNNFCFFLELPLRRRVMLILRNFFPKIYNIILKRRGKLNE